MTWHDFLKYSKYIAVFYGIAFVIGLIGIWMPDPNRWVLTAGLFFCTAIAANVALGFYYHNHDGAMTLEKNIYLAEQEQAQVITGETPKKDLQILRRQQQADFKEVIDDAVRESLRKQGYR